MRYHSNLLQRYDILPDSAILFPKVHRQFPDTCDEGLWCIVYGLWWEVKLKTKMTIMTNDQMTTTLHFSLFTFHFEHSETRSLRSLVIKVKKDFALSFRLTI